MSDPYSTNARGANNWWYVGRLKEVPGVFSQGKSLDELARIAHLPPENVVTARLTQTRSAGEDKSFVAPRLRFGLVRGGAQCGLEENIRDTSRVIMSDEDLAAPEGAQVKDVEVEV